MITVSSPINFPSLFVLKFIVIDPDVEFPIDDAARPSIISPTGVACGDAETTAIINIANKIAFNPRIVESLK